MSGWSFTPKALDGTALNAAPFKSYFEFDDAPMRLLSRIPIELAPQGNYSFPVSPRSQSESFVLPLKIELTELTQDNLNLLRRVCDRNKGDVTFTFTDGNAADWDATVRIQQLVEEEAWLFTALLYVARPVFRSATLNTDSNVLSTTPASFDLDPAVGGTTRAYPTLQLSPTTPKNHASDYIRRWPVMVAWRSELPGQDSVGNGYPIDVADGALDTATEIAAGRMLANGDDLRVFVDGVEFPRALFGINTANTKVWVPIHFSPRKSATLGVAMPSGTNPATGIGIITVNNPEGLQGWPDKGSFKIGTERIWYGRRTDTQFQLIQRGYRGTTAAGHSAGDEILWIEHDIQIVSDYTAATAPTPPLFAISISSSTNLAHTYNGFFSSPTAQRYGQMLHRFTEDNVKSASLSLTENAGTLIMADRPAGGLYYPYNNVELYAPCGVKAAASALAFDINDGDVGGINEGTEVAVNARVFGIDIATGVERLLATYAKAARAVAAKTITPDVVLQRVRLNAIYAVITGAWRAGLSPNIQDLGSAGLAGGESKAQTFVVDNEAQLVSVAAKLTEASPGDTRNVQLAVGRPTGVVPEPYDEVFNSTIPNASLSTTIQFIDVPTAAGQITIPAGTYAVVMAGQGGAGSVRAYFNTSSNGRGAMFVESAGVWGAASLNRDLDILLIGDGSVVQPEAPSGMEGYVSFDNIVVTFDNTTPRTPLVQRSPQEDIYIIRGTIQHLDNQQRIDVFYIAKNNFDSLTIDCEAKEISLVPTLNQYAPGAVAYISDPEQWMHLTPTAGVAGSNSIVYTEAGIGVINLAVSWWDQWA